MKLEQSGGVTIRHEIVFPQASTLAQLLAQVAAGLTGVTLGQILTALAQLSQEVATMATNQDRLAADETRLQGIVAGEAADIAGIQQVQQSNATAIQALRDQLTAAGIDPATLGAIEAQLTTLEGNNQTLAGLGGAAPAPATTPPADPTAPAGP